MRPTYSSIGTDDRQDRYLGGSRRPEADVRRLLIVAYAMVGANMKPVQTKLYNYLLAKCFVEPIAQGESDKMATVPKSISAIAREIDRPRQNVSDAMAALIRRGDVLEGRGRVWPNPERLQQFARYLGLPETLPLDPPTERPAPVLNHDGRPELRVINHDGQPAAPVINHDTPAGATRGSTRAPDQELRNSGEDSMTHSPCVCLPDSPAGACAHARPGQDDTHTRGLMDDRSEGKPETPPEAGPRYPWTADELARIEAWSMKHHVGEHVAKQLPTIRGLYPAAWVIPAMKRALIQKSVAFRYIQVILSNWEAVGGPNRGPEADYDDDMIPIRRPTLAPLEPAPARPTASRFPISNSQRVIDMMSNARSLIRQGIDPFARKPFAGEVTDETRDRDVDH